MAPRQADRPRLRRGRVRTPTVLQMEMVECGAASLGILLEHFGRVVPLAELRRLCGVSRDGSKASNILRAARSLGLVAKGFKKELAELAELPYPYIVFWNFNHFLVVEGARGDQVFLNDPAVGPRVVSAAEFDEGFTGVVLVVTPGAEFAPGGSRPSTVRGAWRRLRPAGGAFLLCGLAAFLLVIPGLATAALARVFVDNVVVQHFDDWARPIILGLIVAALVRAALLAIELRLLRLINAKLSVGMSSRFVWHLLHLPASFYMQRYSGEVAHRVALNDRAADLLSGRMVSTALDVPMMIFYGAAMFHIDRALTAAAVGLALLHVLILQFAIRRRTVAAQRFQQEAGKLGGAAIAGLQSIRTIKASALEHDFFSRIAGRYATTANMWQQLSTATLSLSLLPRFVGGVLAVLVLVVGGLRVMDGALSIGTLIAFQTLAASFFTPVNNLMSFGGALQVLDSDLTRLDDVLRSPIEERAEAAPAGELRRLSGHLTLRDLRFGYSPAAPPLIDGLSLDLHPGQRIAIVGGSGSGKSTVARLIAGLYQPDAGAVLFDGMPRSAIPREVMTQSLAMVDQEILLFAGTVRDNLTLWDPTILDAQIVAACRDAVIHDDIVALPDGYSSRLTEGAANLSGGQRQRIEIARALCGNPSILVLDEATSGLDTETERALDLRLRQRGCSCVIVAHRLSTIRDADEIIVLDHGRIVERGTHEQLMHRQGRYRQLVSSDSATRA